MNGLAKMSIAAILFLSLFAKGCVPPGAKLASMQKRQITTRLIEGSYEDTYRAALTVFQDQDYIIQNTDMQAGLIVAYVDRASSAATETTGSLLGALFTANSGTTTTAGTGFELSCIVSKISETSTEMRLSIHKTAYGKSGSTVNQKTKQIYNTKVFQNFFNQVIIEVKRREAMR